MNNIKQLDSEYVANTYNRFDLCLTHGKGSIVYDENGKEYIDLGAGIAVNTFGFADKVWQEAICNQAAKLQHTSNLYYTEPCVTLAKMLCESTGMKKVFFSNSGAEANECAIKAARKWAHTEKGSEYSTIVTLKNSFHGRTIATLAATGQDGFHSEFYPFPEGFVYATANDIENLQKTVADNKCAAIMIELVQGEGGVLTLTTDFVKAVFEIAKDNNLLVIIDEVQTGNGRTGALYAFMNFGVTPDIVTTAKGLAGGLPLGATIFSEKVQNTFTPTSHGSTFGGNPVCCAGAVSILERLDEDLLSEVKKKSDYIIKELTSAVGVVSISGMGLMLGIEIEKPIKETIAECMSRGVLVLSAKNKLRLLPALNIPFEQLQKAVNIIEEVLAL